jgi:hypothetical protein
VTAAIAEFIEALRATQRSGARQIVQIDSAD